MNILTALKSRSFFLQHCNSVTLKVFLFTAEVESAIKEADPAFGKQQSISTGKEGAISKMQILITAKRGTLESACLLTGCYSFGGVFNVEVIAHQLCELYLSTTVYWNGQSITDAISESSRAPTCFYLAFLIQMLNPCPGGISILL